MDSHDAPAVRWPLELDRMEAEQSFPAGTNHLPDCAQRRGWESCDCKYDPWEDEKQQKRILLDKMTDRDLPMRIAPVIILLYLVIAMWLAVWGTWCLADWLIWSLVKWL